MASAQRTRKGRGLCSVRGCAAVDGLTQRKVRQGEWSDRRWPLHSAAGPGADDVHGHSASWTAFHRGWSTQAAAHSRMGRIPSRKARTFAHRTERRSHQKERLKPARGDSTFGMTDTAYASWRPLPRTSDSATSSRGDVLRVKSQMVTQSSIRCRVGNLWSAVPPIAPAPAGTHEIVEGEDP